MLKQYCLTSKDTSDLFVGIRFSDGKPSIVFPHGYSLSDDDSECRKDVFRLLAVLQSFSEHRVGDMNKRKDSNIKSFPLSSYQFIIQDYLSHGYYTENEIRYIQAQRGKINWKRTIQQEQAQIDDSNVVYLRFQTKTNQINSNNLITQIHKYCVYFCFLKFGWLYLSSSFLPEKPLIPFNKKLFVNTLSVALSETFNDQKRTLFKSMINVINDNDEDISIKNISIGVNKFDPIWERLIDYVFGEEDKDKYFPHAKWHIIKNGKHEQSSALVPDTIMKYQNKIYVLDAKYYQYGITNYVSDLPATSSIQKQITYGKHIAEQMGEVPVNNVYNAFVMPYKSDTNEVIKFVSVATADWETYNDKTNNYAYVLGILLDTRWLITNYVRHNNADIEKMAEAIETSLEFYRSNFDSSH